VQLDAVETRSDGVARRLDELRLHGGQLVERELAGLLEGVDAELAEVRLTGRPDRRGGDRWRGVGPQDAVGHATAMQDLHEDAAALGVHGVRDAPPARDLLVGVEPRGVHVALAGPRWAGCPRR
jgi:hypothetical protein